MICDSWSEAAAEIEADLDDALRCRDSELIGRQAASLRFTVQETCREWATQAVREFSLRLDLDPRLEAYVLWRPRGADRGELGRAVRVGAGLCEAGELVPTWSQERDACTGERHPLLCYEELREVVKRYLAFDDG